VPLLVVLAAVLLWALLRNGSAPLLGTTDEATGGSASQAPSLNPQSPSGQLDNITQAIATLEGFGIQGNRPTRDNNPGDVKAALGMIGTDAPGGIAQFSDVGDGWDALAGWVKSHVAAHPDWDFYDFTHYYATGDTLGTPAAGEANPDSSAEYIADYLGVDPATPVSTLIEGS
jgi:hypothetical protein